MIIDSHCHLDFEPMKSSLDEVVERALQNGVNYLLTISTEDKKFDQIIKIISTYKNVYGTYGIHPHEAKVHKEINKEVILKRIKQSKKIIGIGETGLDFFYKNSDINEQVKLFEEHIYSSIEANLPLVIHTRSAEKKTFEILNNFSKNNDLKILIHCFTGSKEFAHKLLDLGAYISASGIVTFKKSKDLAETFGTMPLDKILVETDSPYLSPEPLRGRSNEPSNIIHTLKFLSKIKNINYEKFCTHTSENFFKLFGKLN